MSVPSFLKTLLNPFIQKYVGVNGAAIVIAGDLGAPNQTVATSSFYTVLFDKTIQVGQVSLDTEVGKKIHPV